MTAIPRHLSAKGKAFFTEMVDEYSIADAGGIALLTRAAECVDRLAEAQTAIAKFGAIVKNQYGKPALNPATKLEKEARSDFLAAMRQLNLDIKVSQGPGRPPLQAV